MRKLFYILLFPLILSCGSIKFAGNPMTTPLLKYNKKEPLVEEQKKFWHLMDLLTDSIAGMSVDRAHNELIKKEKGETVIVAVIDSGVDIHHPDLKGVIWVNEDEIPNNLIDDDQNGYVDDIHGWNFLGASELENMESVRLQKKETPGSEAYEKLEKQRLKSIKSKKKELSDIEDMIQRGQKSDSIIKATLGKKEYSIEEAESFSPKTFAFMEALIFKRFLEENQLTKSKLEIYKKGAQSGIDAHYNIEFDGRAVVGDDPDNIDDRGMEMLMLLVPKRKVPTTAPMCLESLLPTAVMTMAIGAFLIVPR
jgi:hypothetical protein